MSAVLDSRPLSTLPQVIARAGHLKVSVAQDPIDVERAQRLRHQVFVREWGARPTSRDALDRDPFDAHCRHLIVADTERDEVVGTYRVLMPEAARSLGCLYTEREFWLTRLAPVRDELVELGRSCVHPDYRTGVAIRLLWSGLSALLACTGHRYLIGCASVPAHDGGVAAANLYQALAATHLADETWRVWPRDRLAVEALADGQPARIPPLMKGYLRAGARLLGEPHRDAEFGCVDFPLLLNLDELNARYRRRFDVLP